MQLAEIMKAMVLEKAKQPLALKTLPIPVPLSHQVLVKIIACGVCRTDLHILDGELDHPKLPLIMGHEIIGTIVGLGDQAKVYRQGDIVGIPWLAQTCGICKYCLNKRENLCEQALFTGYTKDGGFAEYTTVHQQYCFPISPAYANASGAPLLCAGLIGYRSYSMIEKSAQKIGIYGFGAAAHILVQIAIAQGKDIFAFTRDGDQSSQDYAIKLGVVWAEDLSKPGITKVDAAIIFAPVGELIPKALSDIYKGGIVICGGIHMSDIPSFPYRLLWEERTVKSVANLTRKDGNEFFKLIDKIPVQTDVHSYRLEQANEALEDLRNGNIKGAAVLVMD